MLDVKTELEKLHPRIKYYLLEWKDGNMGQFVNEFDGRKLNELSKNELRRLFKIASTQDYRNL